MTLSFNRLSLLSALLFLTAFGLLPARGGSTHEPTGSAPATYHVYGQITTTTPGVNVAGITVSLAASSTATPVTVKTFANGYFGFINVAPGTYVVTPHADGLTFDPPFRTVTVTTEMATGVNFKASHPAPTTQHVYGRISTTVTGLSVSGITVSLTSATSSTPVNVTTNPEGYFGFADVAPGSYLVTPHADGVVFSPAYRLVTVAHEVVSGVNFTAWRHTSTNQHVYGQIITTVTGLHVSGITVSLTTPNNAAPVNVTTNGDGYFGFVDVAPGSYVVTPHADGLTFNPAHREITVTNTFVTGVNFTASRTTTTAAAYHIYGKINTASVGIHPAGIIVALVKAGATTILKTTITNAEGYFVFTDVAPGSYVVYPHADGLAFSPGYLPVPVTDANAIAGIFTVSPKVLPAP